MGDLADRRELVLGDHDPVPIAVERERGDEPADSRQHGRRHGDVVGLGMQQPRNR